MPDSTPGSTPGVIQTIINSHAAANLSYYMECSDTMVGASPSLTVNIAMMV
jgi:hypothetical protein